ncbi:hypothetical protein T440DRAFT_538244 [Plenodomus tracheiphilus IPT5]|uniref:Heterokaryon incompatibility domain-containing protein n=1 Tax=Plenodomus tracheiphilus IPT5 TaxID=1408161 RepID=A0A6A7AZG3_9PLEO|nr:hypothetical protein T440DRAFT_538244 [Plenodomus tracheiphilus IPT5]
MFRWYQNAKRCYAWYISTISSQSSAGRMLQSRDVNLRNSRWFTRGWTLQELLAPVSVSFFTREGAMIGDRKSLVPILHEITRIAVEASEGKPMPHFTWDERIS